MGDFVVVEAIPLIVESGIISICPLLICPSWLITAKRSYSYIISGPGYVEVVPLFSFSVSFMASVVKGTMFREAGKRIAVSIFRAEDLSFVLCSNLLN